MRGMAMLVWLTQLGLSVAIPPAGFILLAVWLKNSRGWGQWVIWAGIVLGMVFAIDGLRHNLKVMKKMSENVHDDTPTGISFNDHD